MVGHRICLNGEIWLIIRKLTLLPLLIWATDPSPPDTMGKQGVISNISLAKHYVVACH